MILRLYKPCNANSSFRGFAFPNAFGNRLRMLRFLTVLSLVLVAYACAPAQRTSPVLDPSAEDRIIAGRAITALRQLDDDVFVYRSLGEFEAGRALARVSLGTFHEHLSEATSEIEAVLPRLNNPGLKAELRNALASYRDGAYCWEKVHRARVIKFRADETVTTPSNSFFSANLPYTVAIHWRQAGKHLQRAIRQLG